MLKTKNKQGVNDVLEAEAAVKFTVWSCGKNAKLKSAKNITTAAMKRTMKRGTPRKRWRDEVEEDLSITRNKNWQVGNGQRPSEMEEDCIRSHDPQRTVVLKVEEQKKKKKGV